MIPGTPYDVLMLHLLRMGHFQRRSGAWRFGTKTITDSVVDRLVASGRAASDGERVWLKVSGAAE